MDLRKLKKLIDLVEESELRTGGHGGEEKVKIVKGGSSGKRSSSFPRPPGGEPPAAEAVTALAAAALPPHKGGADITRRHIVKSPMVGTFYRSGSPGAKPSSRLRYGQGGQAICIIER